MFQITVKQLADVFQDRTQYPEGSELNVSYKKVPETALYKVDYKLVVGDTELIRGGWENITKADANKMICEDIIHPLLSRGHYLLHSYVNQTKADNGEDNSDTDRASKP